LIVIDLDDVDERPLVARANDLRRVGLSAAITAQAAAEAAACPHRNRASKADAARSHFT
jgi:hypothetical protein